MSDADIERLDSRDIPHNNHDEIRAFLVVKNEMLRIPYFLQYYREKGVSRFFFVDNNSDDETVRYLLDQPDCHVFLARGSYAKTQSGLRWSAQLLDQYGVGHWCLTLDADELLVWPQAERSTIKQLCDWLERNGDQGIFTFMLDMYSRGAVRDIEYKQGMDFLSACSLFDADYKILPRSRTAFWKGAPFPPLKAHGGPRLRLSYPDDISVGTSLSRYVVHVYRQLGSKLVERGLLKANPSFHNPPALYKIPLVKWAAGYRYLYSTHTMAPDIRLADVSGVLLHFKFFSDFYDKIDYAVQSKEHFGASMVYKRYADMLEVNEGKSLFEYENTVEYKGTQDLVEKELMKTTQAFDQYIKG